MPKYKPATEKLKVKNLLKPYIESGFNQRELARQRGVSPATINEQIHRQSPIIQKTFAQLLDKVGLTDNNLAKGLREGRVAVRPDPLGPGILPDYNCRHKYIVTCLELKGHLKHNGNGKGISIVNIIYGHRRDDRVIQTQQEESTPTKEIDVENK